jgi:hypothetical protein
MTKTRGAFGRVCLGRVRPSRRAQGGAPQDEGRGWAQRDENPEWLPKVQSRSRASTATSKPTRSAPKVLILRRPPLGPSRRTLPLQFLLHRTPSRNRRQPLIPARNQPLLLLPRPAFKLPLAREAVSQAVKSFGVDENHRPPQRGIAVINPLIMLPDPRLDRLFGRADIVGAVGTEEDVNNEQHRINTR